MRTIIQRVSRASVTVNGELISSIERGICVLVGISRDDKPEDMDYMVRKVLNLRLFDDENGRRWASSVKELGLEILCVSQFTLHATLKGNKPDFRHSMDGDSSRLFYNTFLAKLRSEYNAELIKDGQFGASMGVNIVNEGPVTIAIDSPHDRDREGQRGTEKGKGKGGDEGSAV